MVGTAIGREHGPMAKQQTRKKRRGHARSKLEGDLDQLLDQHADHSVIREAMERMGAASAQRLMYTTYPACTSNA